MELGYFETSLDVADIAASLAFYEKLGFERVDGGVDIRNVSLQKGNCRLGLYQGYLDPKRTQLIFWQGDIEAIAAELTAQGVEFFRGPNKDEHGAAFMLIDPDGHPIYAINLSVFHFPHPAHARPADATPRTAKGTGPRLGWFILSLAVQDLERSIGFYRKLGFDIFSRQDRSATLRHGDCTIGLYQGLIDLKPVELTFWQGDVYAIASNLMARGLVFERGPTTNAGEGAGDGAVLRDPDGHQIHFINVERLRRGEPA
jgi:catechol 2,3-dioxygenase-like lactoylglutathione lyase family enzyme